MENETKTEIALSLAEAGERFQRTRQSLYMAIRKGRLKAYREKNNRWKIRLSDWERYYSTRYTRDYSVFNGQPLYDINRGTYSVNLACRFLDIPLQKMYFAIRSGKILFTRKGSAYIFTEKHLLDYADKHLGKKIQIAG